MRKTCKKWHSVRKDRGKGKLLKEKKASWLECMLRQELPIDIVQGNEKRYIE